MSHRTQTAHVGASSTHVIDRESLQRSALPLAQQSQLHRLATAHVLANTRGSCCTGLAHALPRHLHAASRPPLPSDRKNQRCKARRRLPTHAPSRSAVPHSREPSNLTAPAARRCSALPTAHCPHCTLLCSPDTPARATAAKRKLVAATATAAETWSMHTAKPARDARYAGYKARAPATEDARPTIASMMRSAGWP